jgi:hypothetical protein
MSELKFEEDKIISSNYKSREIFGKNKIPKMARFIVKTGVIKKEKHAYMCMFGIVLIASISTGVILFFTYGNTIQSGLNYNEMTASQKDKIPLAEQKYLERRK